MWDFANKMECHNNELNNIIHIGKLLYKKIWTKSYSYTNNAMHLK